MYRWRVDSLMRGDAVNYADRTGPLLLSGGLGLAMLCVIVYSASTGFRL